MTAKIFLAVLGFLVFLYLFNRPLNFLSSFAYEVSGTFLVVVFAVARSIFFGMVVYYLFVFIGHFSRIETFSDIITVLTARPSQHGASGFYGIIFGLAVAVFVWTDRSRMNARSGQSNRIRGRGIMSDAYVPRKLTAWQRFRNFIIRLSR